MADKVGGSLGRTLLIGRKFERQRLSELRRLAAKGVGGVAVLAGAAGSGKSRLAEHCATQAEADRMHVVTARCSPHEVSAPFSAFASVIDPSDFDVKRGHQRGVLEAGAPSHPGLAVADHLVDQISAAATNAAVLLVVEDVHWADPDTIHCLQLLAVRAKSTGFAMLLTARAPVPGDALDRRFQEWRNHPSIAPEILELAPMTDSEIEQVAATRLGAQIGPKLSNALKGAQGNPLLALVIVESAAEELVFIDQRCDLGDEYVVDPGSILRRTVQTLDREVLRVLQVAAVLGTQVRIELLSSMSGRSTIDVIAALDAAATAGILHIDSRTYRFRHDLWREALLESLTDDGRAALHVEAARLLILRGADDAEVADHFVRGGRAGDAATVEWLLDTAQRMCRSDPGTALRLIDTALTIERSPTPRLLRTRFEALAGCGRSGEAETLGRALILDTVDPFELARLHRELGLVLFVQAKAAPACDELETVVELLAGTDGHMRAVAELSFAVLLSLDLDRARGLAAIALGMGDDAHAVVASCAVLTVVAVFRAELESAAEQASSMLLHAERWVASEAHQYQPWFCAGLLAAETDDLAEVERLTREGRDIAVRSGSAWAVAAYDGLAAFAALRSGHLADAEAFALAAIDFSDEGDSFGILIWCHSFVAEVALAQGDVARAELHTAAAEAILATGRAGFGLDHVAVCRSFLHEIQGDTEAACSAVEEIWHAFSALGLDLSRHWMGPRLTRLAMATGRPDLADQVVSSLEEVAQRAGLATMRADALLAQAWQKRSAGLAAEASSLLIASPRRFQRAEALVGAAVLSFEAGENAAGVAAAAAAADLFGAVGATAPAEAAARLVPLNGRRRARPATGFESLTRSERAVLELVAAGSGNDAIAAQLHLSRRTVESHVSAAYRKLGVTTRVQLALAARQGGLGEPTLL